MKQYLEAGKIVTTHGVHGEVKVYPYCDSAAMFTDFSVLYFGSGGDKKLEVENVRPQNNMAIVKLKDVDSVEEARKLIDRILYFDRNDVKLDDGAHFIDDLLGSDVVDADSDTVYGTLSDVTSNGAHDVFHIKTKVGMRYVPAVPEFVLSVEPLEKKIIVRPIPGMLD